MTTAARPQHSLEAWADCRSHYNHKNITSMIRVYDQKVPNEAKNSSKLVWNISNAAAVLAFHSALPDKQGRNRSDFSIKELEVCLMTVRKTMIFVDLSRNVNSCLTDILPSLFHKVIDAQKECFSLRRQKTCWDAQSSPMNLQHSHLIQNRGNGIALQASKMKSIDDLRDSAYEATGDFGGISPVSCIEFDLSLDLIDRVVDISNLVPANERDSSNIMRRSSEIIQKRRANALPRSNSTLENQSLYPSTEIVQEIEEPDVDILFLKGRAGISNRTLREQQKQQEFHSRGKSPHDRRSSTGAEPQRLASIEAQKRASIEFQKRASAEAQKRASIEFQGGSPVETQRKASLERRAPVSAAARQNSVDESERGERGEYFATFHQQESYRSANSGSTGTKSSYGERKPAARPQETGRPAHQSDTSQGFRSLEKENLERQGSYRSIDRPLRQDTRHNLLMDRGGENSLRNLMHARRESFAKIQRPDFSQETSLRKLSNERENSFRRRGSFNSNSSCGSKRSLARNHSSNSGYYDPHSPPSPSGPPPEKMRFTHQTRGEDLQIEITPGVFAVLRGAEETWQAVEEGDVIYTECICCSTPIMCISDAQYVLCPECKVVSPLEGQNRHGAGGVGLGLRSNDNNGNRRDHRRRNYQRQYTDPGPPTQRLQEEYGRWGGYQDDYRGRQEDSRGRRGGHQHPDYYDHGGRVRPNDYHDQEFGRYY